MPPFTFQEARQCVLQQVGAQHRNLTRETVDLQEAAGRVLAENVTADRDYPAVARSVRDGFAVRAADLPGALDVIGEVRAGATFEGTVGPGQAVEIMTGAPLPAGADAVVMVEYVRRDGERIITERSAEPGEFINPKGCEAGSGDVLLESGKRLDFADVAMLAAAGHEQVAVYARPKVALIATGDEIVSVGSTPRPHQIRNSNVHSLAVQVRRAGGQPSILPVARDEESHTRELIEQSLAADLVLLSGGVSAGKYDVVERVLADLGAKFYFDRVLIQPGQPLVFGNVRGKYFFGLPGNPSSTMVTFELFARTAVEIIGGQREVDLHMPYARLTRDFRHRTGLTRFLPARLSENGSAVTPIPWHGSSDVPALTRANAFLVAEPDRAEWSAGDWIRVLLK
ncbi:MAG: gephyrin-like molybdotransferase Glp [Bryobacteraceae bacterium]